MRQVVSSLTTNNTAAAEPEEKALEEQDDGGRGLGLLGDAIVVSATAIEVGVPLLRKPSRRHR